MLERPRSCAYEVVQSFDQYGISLPRLWGDFAGRTGATSLSLDSTPRATRKDWHYSELSACRDLLVETVIMSPFLPLSQLDATPVVGITPLLTVQAPTMHHWEFLHAESSCPLQNDQRQNWLQRLGLEQVPPLQDSVLLHWISQLLLKSNAVMRAHDTARSRKKALDLKGYPTPVYLANVANG